MRRRKTKSIWVRSGFLSSYNLHSLPIFSDANPKVTLNSYRNLQAFWSSGSLRNLLRSLPTLLGPLHLLSRSVLLLANPIRSQASAVRSWILPRGYGYLPYFEARRRRRRTHRRFSDRVSFGESFCFLNNAEPLIHLSRQCNDGKDAFDDDTALRILGPDKMGSWVSFKNSSSRRVFTSDNVPFLADSRSRDRGSSQGTLIELSIIKFY